VTIPGRTPSWREIEDFCKKDQWTLIRSRDHTFWQKVLPSGEVLETHTSFGGDKTMSQGRFGAILRNQLRVTRPEFWAVLQTGDPVDRPGEGGEGFAPAHEAWVVFVLKKYGMSDDEIGELTPDYAQAFLYEKWAEESPA
jgi:hypothetical protein